MTVLVADDPGMNSYVTSLIEAYKDAGLNVICGWHNFFYSNIKPDILHIQWPEKIYNWYPFLTLSEKEKYNKIEERLKWYKENNVVILHTIHNIQPHIPEKLDFERSIFELIIKYSDILCHHCKKSIELLNQNYPGVLEKKNIITPIGDYSIDYKKLTKNEARQKLNIPENKFVILNFGSQAKYKNNNFLESIFKKLPIKEKYLLTAGNYGLGGYSKPAMIYHLIKKQVKMKLKYSNKKYFYKSVPPDDLPYYVNSADMFFLAHSKSLNSGVLPLAATFAKPVVFPDIGCFKEQMQDWIYESYEKDNLESAAVAINKMFSFIKNSAKSFDNSLWLEKNSWKKHVQIILNSIVNYAK